MRYSKSTTELHPLSKRYPEYLKKINEIIVEEGGTYLPFGNEVGLAFDKIKKSSDDTNVTRMNSMDVVLGMKDGKKPFTLLVEFKLECKGTKKLKDGDCKDKINDTKILLFGSGLPIHNKYVFIFNDNLLKESRSVLTRTLNNPATEVIGLDELKQNYF